jgi:hypothetical protein
MATYKGINGFAVQSVATDPSPSNEGQVWYNNASYAFKLAALTTVGTWATGGNLNYSGDGVAGAGIQTAALAIGGTPSAVNSYNGTSWTTVNNLNTQRAYLAAANAGTQTATLAFGGNITGAGETGSESWNGTNWTNTPSLNTGKFATAGFGIQTAAINMGGAVGNSNPFTLTNASESWNGSSWTNGPTLNTSRYALTGFGTQTAGIASLGSSGPNGAINISSGFTESWNGSSWTTITSANTGRYYPTGFGTQTSAVLAGGITIPGVTGATEFYNGTSWTSNPNSLATARGTLASGGASNSAGVVFGGGSSNATEEWTGPGTPVTRTITTS